MTPKKTPTTRAKHPWTSFRDNGDHSALADLLVQALGAAADSGQVTRLRRIIERKNEAQYGGAFWSRQTAETYLEQVRRFTAWAIRVLGERGYGTEHVADIE